MNDCLRPSAAAQLRPEADAGSRYARPAQLRPGTLGRPESESEVGLFKSWHDRDWSKRSGDVCAGLTRSHWIDPPVGVIRGRSQRDCGLIPRPWVLLGHGRLVALRRVCPSGDGRVLPSVSWRLPRLIVSASSERVPLARGGLPRARSCRPRCRLLVNCRRCCRIGTLCVSPLQRDTWRAVAPGSSDDSIRSAELVA